MPSKQRKQKQKDHKTENKKIIKQTQTQSLVSPLKSLCVTPTMNTSNSSKTRKGDSMASHNAIMKQIVENDLSPPDSDFVSFVDVPFDS